MDVNRDYEDAGRLSHLLWEVSARAAAIADAALADSPLTPTSSGVLDAVAANPGTSIAALARSLPTTQQAISQVVGRLERLGYLVRQLGSRGHGIALHITPEGARARQDANRRLCQADDDLARMLGQVPHDRLVELLEQARGALENAGRRTVATSADAK